MTMTNIMVYAFCHSTQEAEDQEFGGHPELYNERLVGCTVGKSHAN